MALSHMERTLKLVRMMPGCLRAKAVEKWQPKPWISAQAGVRIDLFGADVQALFLNRNEGYILAIQICDMSSRKKHVESAMASYEVIDWIAANGFFQVWAWRKLKVGNLQRWKCNQTAIYVNEEDGEPYTQLIEDAA